MANLFLNSFQLPIAKSTCVAGIIIDTSNLDHEQSERLKHHAIRISHEKDAELWNRHPELASIEEAYFLNWEDEVSDLTSRLRTIQITIDLNRDIRLARAWIVRQLVRCFRAKGCPCDRDFIGRVVVYEQVEEDAQKWTYQKYALNPRYTDQCEGWQLDVMPLGKSVVGKRPCTELHLRNESFKVIAGTQVVRANRLNGFHWAVCRGEFYPIVNLKIAPLVGCSPVRSYNRDKYNDKRQLLSDFLKTWMATSDFCAAMGINPVDGSCMITVTDDNIGHVDDDVRKLRFGNNAVAQNTRLGFEEHGCALQPPCDYTLFAIYPSTAEGKVGILRNIIVSGKDNNFICPLSHYLHRLVYWDDDLSFGYTQGAESLDEVVETLNDVGFSPDKKYMAIVITTSKEGAASSREEAFYYGLKLELLRKGIVSQMICADIIKEEPNFRYTLQNLAAAIIGKQAGLPWSLPRVPESKDLVVGVGASRRSGEKEPYLGSAFYFDYKGNYYKFDYCKAENLKALKHSIVKAVLEFYDKCKSAPDRLIIHYYKTMNKYESREVEDALRGMNVRCPVYVVNIVTTTEDDLIAFDMESKKLMPVSGTYIRLRKSQYLLYCNERFGNDDSRVNRMLFPIKLTIYRGNQTQDEKPWEEVVREIITQTYQFCRLYYRSVAVQNKPITIAYTELLAKYVSYFNDGELPNAGRRGLWMI